MYFRIFFKKIAGSIYNVDKQRTGEIMVNWLRVLGVIYSGLSVILSIITFIISDSVIISCLSLFGILQGVTVNTILYYYSRIFLEAEKQSAFLEKLFYSEKFPVSKIPR
jgi:hypothetical protein